MPILSEIVSDNNDAEKELLRRLRALHLIDSSDKRWLSIAKTHFELGFMALDRAISDMPRVFSAPEVDEP